jgi:GNAT superfamily N-acetyltransferase
VTRAEVIPYDPGFKDEVAKLLTLLVSRDPARARRYFEWQYEENPYFEDPILYLARADGQIVGMRGLVGAKWQAGVNGGPVVIPYPDDHIVVEDRRGSGIVTLIMRAMLADAEARGYHLLCNVSAGIVTNLTSLAAGWKRVGAMQPVARAFRPGGPEPWSSSAEAFQRLDRAGCGAGSGEGTAITVSNASRLEAMAALVERMGHDGRMRHVRDAAWLTWRYRHPLREYRFLWHETAGLLDGYLVVRRYTDPQAQSRRADIVDWEATGEPIAAVLLDRVIEWGRFAELGCWTATLPEARHRLLIQAGFEPTDLDLRARGLPGLLLMALGGGDSGVAWNLNGRHLPDLAQWDLRQVYTMHG